MVSISSNPVGGKGRSRSNRQLDCRHLLQQIEIQLKCSQINLRYKLTSVNTSKRGWRSILLVQCHCLWSRWKKQLMSGLTDRMMQQSANFEQQWLQRKLVSTSMSWSLLTATTNLMLSKDPLPKLIRLVSLKRHCDRRDFVKMMSLNSKDFGRSAWKCSQVISLRGASS